MIKLESPFLKQCTIKAFSFTLKVSGRRRLKRQVNDHPGEIYTIIGRTTLQEGDRQDEGEYGYTWSHLKTHTVYIVAKSIGQRFKVLPEDLELVGDGERE